MFCLASIFLLHEGSGPKSSIQDKTVDNLNSKCLRSLKVGQNLSIISRILKKVHNVCCVNSKNSTQNEMHFLRRKRKIHKKSLKYVNQLYKF